MTQQICSPDTLKQGTVTRKYRLDLPLKSPVSATTTVYFFSCSSADSIFRRLSGDWDMALRGNPFIPLQRCARERKKTQQNCSSEHEDTGTEKKKEDPSKVERALVSRAVAAGGGPNLFIPGDWRSWITNDRHEKRHPTAEFNQWDRRGGTNLRGTVALFSTEFNRFLSLNSFPLRTLLCLLKYIVYL